MKPLSPLLLYARSRALPGALVALAGTAAVAAGTARWLETIPGSGPSDRLPVVVLGPLLAAAAVGTCLRAPSDELDRTAVRPWWPRRLAHLLVPAALAALLLALAVPGHPAEFGAPAAVRNTLGLVGVAAASAVLLGARLSWLPPALYAGAVPLAAPAGAGGAADWWAWVARPGPQGGAWTAAALAFAAGTALYAWRGARHGPGGR
ncbi:hypothetical protein [Streptomyces sp. NPDC096068]|uniref:hypothetical protein n=1 Tax=Streptomyces sp. NPDC096068 TaxID=3155424 RepID=UPI003322B662